MAKLIARLEVPVSSRRFVMLRLRSSVARLPPSAGHGLSRYLWAP